VAGEGVLRAAGVDDGAFAAGDLDDGGVDVEAADGFGEASSWVKTTPGGSGRGLEDAREAVDAGRVHRLDGSSMTTKRNGLSGRVARG